MIVKRSDFEEYRLQSRAIKDIRMTGRNTQGVRLISLDKDDVVSSVAKVVAKED